MFSPEHTTFDKKSSNIKDNSYLLSVLQTDSTIRISRSTLKNINLLKMELNTYNRKKKLSEKNKSYQCLNSNSKLYLNSINFLPYVLKRNSSNIKNMNIPKNKPNQSYINEFNFSVIDNQKKKIKSRNTNQSSFCNTYYTNTLNKSETEKSQIIFTKFKINVPFYRYLYLRDKSFIEFNKDTRNIRYLKINRLNGKKALDKLQDNIIFNSEKEEYEKNIFNQKKILLDIYKDNFNQYLIYLQKKMNEESAINYNLSNKKNILINEISYIKNKINKQLATFENNLDDKFFLSCVKCSSLKYNNLSKESQIDIFYDLYKLFLIKDKINIEFLYEISNKQKNITNEFYNYLNKMEQRIRNNIDSNKRNIFLGYIFASLDKNNFSNLYNNITQEYIKNHKLNKIFNTPEEFDKKMIEISYNNKLLLDEFNTINIIKSKLANELQIEIDRKKKEADIMNIAIGKVKSAEQKLNIIKNQYFNNLNEYNLIKNNINDISKSIKSIKEKINLIIDNIMEYNPLKKKYFVSTKIINEPISLIDKITICENALNYLIKYKTSQMIKRPDDYNILMKDLKKEQLINRFKNKAETMKLIAELKLKKIYEKNNKILFLPLRKINEKKKIK